MIRVLVAAASAVTRAGLEAILIREPGFTVVGGANASLADDVLEHEPDVVVVESGGDGDDPVALARLISSDVDDGSRPAPALVFLTDDRDPGVLSDALRAGARGVLPRDAGASEILAAVSAAAAGLVSVARELTGALWSASASERATPGSNGAAPGPAPLTARELEVLRMIADGLANKQIAARLAISEHTVKFHVGSVFAKMQVASRAEAVMAGARRGLIVL